MVTKTILNYTSLGYLLQEEARYTEFPQNLYEQRALFGMSVLFLLGSMIVSLFCYYEYYLNGSELDNKVFFF